MSRIKLFFGLLLALTALNFAAASFARAQAANTSNSGIVKCGNETNNPCTVEDVFNVFVNFTNYLIGLAGFVAIASIIFAGFQMVAGSGTSKYEVGKKRLINSILGLVLVMIAFLLVNAAFSATLGIGVLGDNLLLNKPQEYICQDGVNCDTSTPPANTPNSNTPVKNGP